MTLDTATTPEIRASNAQDTSAAAPPRLRIVRREELAREDDGPTRGWAHIGFDDYPEQAPGRLNFEPLLLFGEGFLHDGEGFGMHHHAGIENLLVVLEGCIEHRGSDGSHWHLRRNDVFSMSAGAGGEHEEFARAETHALVIWLRSDEPEAPCRFDHATVPGRESGFSTLASGGARRTGGLELRRDAALLRADLTPGLELVHPLEANRRAYLIALDNEVSINSATLRPGDRIMAEGPGPLHIRAADRARLFLVDMT